MSNIHAHAFQFRFSRLRLRKNSEELELQNDSALRFENVIRVLWGKLKSYQSNLQYYSELKPAKIIHQISKNNKK